MKHCGTGSFKKRVPGFAYYSSNEFISGLLEGYIDGDGNILKTSCNEIHSSRKVQVNLEEFSKGIYLIQLNGETVDKTVKIVNGFSFCTNTEILSSCVPET